MEVTVAARKMQLTDALKDHATAKVQNSLGVFSIEPLSAEVVLHTEKNRSNPKGQVAEITVFAKKHVIRAEEADADMYTAIDLAAAKVERQLRKYKTKVVDGRKNAPHGGIANVEVAADQIPENTLGSEEENFIVRRKFIEPQLLDEDDAMLQIDLLGHDFFVYKDSVTEQTTVIYRRNDGGYGLIISQS